MTKSLQLFTILVLVPSTFSYGKFFPFSGYQRFDSPSYIPIWTPRENQLLLGGEQFKLHRIPGSSPTISDPEEFIFNQKRQGNYNEAASRQLNQIIEKGENVPFVSSPTLVQPQETSPDSGFREIEYLPTRQPNNIMRGDSRIRNDEKPNTISNFEGIVGVADSYSQNKPIEGITNEFPTEPPTYGSTIVDQPIETPTHIRSISQFAESPSYIEEITETPTYDSNDNDKPIKTPPHVSQPTETYVSPQVDQFDKAPTSESGHVDQPIPPTYQSNSVDEPTQTQIYGSNFVDDSFGTPTHQAGHPIESSTYELHPFKDPIEAQSNVDQVEELPTERIPQELVETPIYGSRHVQQPIENPKYHHVEESIGTHDVVQPTPTPTYESQHVDKPLKTPNYRLHPSSEPSGTLTKGFPSIDQSLEISPSVDQPTGGQTYGSSHDEDPSKAQEPVLHHLKEQTSISRTQHEEVPIYELHAEEPTKAQAYPSQYTSSTDEIPQAQQPIKTLTYGFNRNEDPIETPIFIDQPAGTPIYAARHITDSTDGSTHGSQYVDEPIEDKSYESFATEQPVEMQDYRLRDADEHVDTLPAITSSYGSPTLDEHFEITPIQPPMEDQQPSESVYSPSVSHKQQSHQLTKKKISNAINVGNYIDRPLSVISDHTPTTYERSGIQDSSISNYDELSDSLTPYGTKSVISYDTPTTYDRSGSQDSGNSNDLSTSLTPYGTRTITNEPVATIYDSYASSRKKTKALNSEDKVNIFYGCGLEAIADTEYSYYDTASNQIMDCAPGSKFSESLCTCVHAPNFYDLHATRPISPQVQGNSEEEAGCYLLAVDNVPTSYYSKEFDNVMECAPGTVFSQDVCTCIHNNDAINLAGKNDCEVSYGLTFEDNYLKNSNNQLAVGGGWTVKLGDGMAEFNQDSTINFWSYMGRPYGDSFTIQMKFKDFPGATAKQNLVTNCGTSYDENVPSILVELNKQVAARGVECHVRISVITEISQSEVTLPVKSGAFNTLQVVYNKGHLKAAINHPSGETFSEETQCSGDVLTSTSDLRLGACDMKHDGFVGVMDWFKFYPCSVE